MSKPKLGDWRWYCGVAENDAEMADCGTRAGAIEYGNREHGRGQSFWIVEARMRASDEKEQSAGLRDCSRFAAVRNGCWVIAK